MRVFSMQFEAKEGRGMIVPPAAADPWHHVPGRRTQVIILGYHLDMAHFKRYEEMVSTTHCSCRLSLMARYDTSGVLRLASNEGYVGEVNCNDVPGWDVHWVFLPVSGFPSSPNSLPWYVWLSVHSGYQVFGTGAKENSNSEALPISICQTWKIMAPKHSAPLLSRTASGRLCTCGITREQEKAAHSAKHFKATVPPEIQADIAKVEQEVWEEVNQGIPEPEFNDLADWIHDLGKTYGRIGLYQRSISYFWAAKCLLAKMLVDQKQKGKELRTGIPVPLWDTHFNDARLMHKKMDMIASKLGIKFVAPEVALSAKATARPGEGQTTQQPPAQVP